MPAKINLEIFNVADGIDYLKGEDDGKKILVLVKTPGVLVALADAGVKILGSSVDSIDRAEDRERFEQLLTNCNIPRPKGHTVFDTAGALKAAADVGYPVMVRPSYVFGAVAQWK